MRSATRLTTTLIGMYAGLLGVIHGIFELQQGHVATTSFSISAIGSPCQPEAVSHACWPAVTILPTFLMAGICSIVIGAVVIGWSALMIEQRSGALIAISVALLLVGGGILPPFYGIVAGVAAKRIGQPSDRLPSGLAYLWPWTLVIYFVWVPIEILIGQWADEFLQANGVFILPLTILMLLISVISATVNDSQRANAILEKPT